MKFSKDMGLFGWKQKYRYFNRVLQPMYAAVKDVLNPSNDALASTEDFIT